MRLSLICEFSGAVEIIPWHEDMDALDPWVSADQADKVADRSGIRISRSKNLFYVAVHNEQVVGAIWAAEYNDSDSYFSADPDQVVRVLDFDVAVDPDYRGNAMVGLQLINDAIQYFHSSENDLIRVLVVNPKLVRVLESKYKFEIESHFGNGSAHMVYSRNR